MNEQPRFLLSRLLQRIDSPLGAKRIYYVLLVVCGLLVVVGALIPHHDAYGMGAIVARIPGFYGIYGFVMCALLVLVAKALRRILMRPENYYAPHAIDSEEIQKDGESST
ncbi:MAG: hypothetical protein OXF05_05240 [Hyphomicrobiales bacterium]|nr:hypothetical protein [Hyphomicrobiales bacterium]MCY4032799.1 hypothetical protein [Hyphomicrobiales bacterium]MCY4039096.1 hypothetical protein [Hyphomicrobiales bacterium]